VFPRDGHEARQHVYQRNWDLNPWISGAPGFATTVMKQDNVYMEEFERCKVSPIHYKHQAIKELCAYVIVTAKASSM